MASDTTHLIVGGNLAGGKAAQPLREEGFEGRRVLVSEENTPNQRPSPLTGAAQTLLRGSGGQDAGPASLSQTLAMPGTRPSAPG